MVGSQEQLISNLSERLNMKSIAGNMGVFGLKVDPNISYSDLVSTVINSVLKTACPSIKWQSDDILDEFK